MALPICLMPRTLCISFLFKVLQLLIVVWDWFAYISGLILISEQLMNAVGIVLYAADVASLSLSLSPSVCECMLNPIFYILHAIRSMNYRLHTQDCVSNSLH